MKTKFKLLAIVLSILSLQTFARNNTPQTEKRTSAPYHYLNIQGDMNVTLVQNSTPELTITGTTTQLMNTVTLLRNDTLFITASSSGNKKVSLKINIDNLTGLFVNGKTKIECDGYINSDIFSIKADGGSEIKIDVKTLKADSKATGSRYIDLSGSTGEFAS
jgi:hypothetical protein